MGTDYRKSTSPVHLPRLLFRICCRWDDFSYQFQFYFLSLDRTKCYDDAKYCKWTLWLVWN